MRPKVLSHRVVAAAGGLVLDGLAERGGDAVDLGALGRRRSSPRVKILSPRRTCGRGRRGWLRGSRPGRAGRDDGLDAGEQVAGDDGLCGHVGSLSGGADLVEQVGGELVGDAEPGAERVAGDRPSVAGLVFVGDAAGEGEQRSAGPG